MTEVHAKHDVSRAGHGRPSPFVLDATDDYLRWRSAKLALYPASLGDLWVPVNDPRALSGAEHARIVDVCRRYNMAIYASNLGDLEDKEIPRRFAAQFGLTRLDSNLLADDDAITSIQVVREKSGRGYIPYTNHRLLWHTDGYYNPLSRQVRAFVLHCVRPAAEGGENALVDPEMIYLLLRDENPQYIRALMAPDAMTIPANDESGERQKAQSGPVFAVDPDDGSLHMRYTARTRSIVWKDNDETRAAVAAIERMLANDSPYLFRYRLKSGEGLLSNNVLHNRTAFVDAVDRTRTRLMYRARFFDRICGTESLQKEGVV
jgi:alpha-ketoglutarate-dependent taurine dioxygenase